jgi:hypothetical protein
LWDLHGVWHLAAAAQLSPAASAEQTAALAAALRNKAIFFKHKLPRACMVIERFTK